VVLAPTLGFIKLSCLALYRRVFKTGVNKLSQAILWSLIVIVLGWSISSTAANQFFCGTLSQLGLDVGPSWRLPQMYD
jgi:hypothetical protein